VNITSLRRDLNQERLKNIHGISVKPAIEKLNEQEIKELKSNVQRNTCRILME
jgi:hypothetical protein